MDMRGKIPVTHNNGESLVGCRDVAGQSLEKGNTLLRIAGRQVEIPDMKTAIGSIQFKGPNTSFH
ncbi:MAG: hypothetical protein ACKPKO_36955, partial [Candidatus Fonsibacter sp.]